MRTSTWFFELFAPSLLCIPVILAQTNSPPPDPREMVTREPHTLLQTDCAFRRLGSSGPRKTKLPSALHRDALRAQSFVRNKRRSTK
jgi:hypothetical protein